MSQFIKINDEIQLAVDHVDFLAYQVGEMTEEAHRLLFWLRVILSVVIMVKITGYGDSTLFDHDTIVIAYLLYSIRTEEMTQPRP